MQAVMTDGALRNQPVPAVGWAILVHAFFAALRMVIWFGRKTEKLKFYNGSFRLPLPRSRPDVRYRDE